MRFTNANKLMAISLLISLMAIANTQAYEIVWHTTDAGGGTTSTGTYELSGTIGQGDAGTVSTGTYELTGGFWNAGIAGANCAAIDADNDGVTACDDCDDNNEFIFPGNTEMLCDTFDNDCDPLTEDNPSNACSVEAVTFVAEGPRYIRVTPSAGNVPVALRVTSDDAPCIDRFIDLDPDPDLALGGVSLLVDNPVYRLPADWGTLHVRSEDIVPDYSYTVQPVVEGVGTVAQAITSTTLIHGDADQNAVTNLADALLVVIAFQNEFDGPEGAVDLSPCLPNASVNLADVQQAVLAFQNQPFAQFCPLPCS